MAESEEELKRLLKKVKEESEKADLKVSIQKMEIMASGPMASGQVDGGNNGNSEGPCFLGLQKTANGDCSHEIKKDSCSLGKKP